MSEMAYQTLNLPAEVRNFIYGFLFSGTITKVQKWGAHPEETDITYDPAVALLLVSKATRREATPVLHASTTFRLSSCHQPTYYYYSLECLRLKIGRHALHLVQYLELQLPGFKSAKDIENNFHDSLHALEPLEALRSLSSVTFVLEDGEGCYFEPGAPELLAQARFEKKCIYIGWDRLREILNYKSTTSEVRRRLSHAKLYLKMMVGVQDDEEVTQVSGQPGAQGAGLR